MKPWSTKTLQNKYIKARINEDESIILHKYLLCFSNLYGCIQIQDLWDVFKQYKEKITREKFFDFINITQHEENEYSIFNLNEAYTGETSTETKDKLLVNNSLIKRFDLKFWYLHRLEEFKDVRHGPYVPDKDELFKYNHDLFYESTVGKKMIDFVSNLKASGFEYIKFNDTKKDLVDVNGNSIKGKLLKDIVCYSSWEKFEIDYCKKENKKEYLIKEGSYTCADKILKEIERWISIENPNDFSNSLKYVLDYLNYDFGVELSKDKAEEFINLYIELVNKSNRWSMFGWSPNELRNTAPMLDGPIELQIGPNMQKMIDNGEYDLKEMEKMIKDNNMNISISMQGHDDSYVDIMEENNAYLDDFRKFLEKRNYRENVIDEHVGRVEYYINDYLLLGMPKHMQEGCSFDVVGFIEIKVNEKVMPASVHNIDFFLASIRLFYECMCEKKLISKEQLKEFNENIKNCKDEMIEDYYDKNPKEIDLYDVVETIEQAHGFGEGFINVKTGEKEFLPVDEGTYDGDIDDLYSKLDGLNWVKVPEVDDYEIMTRFSLSLKNQKQSDKLYEILHNKKAYKNFKDAIYDMNIEDDYYDFYDSKIEELAKSWLEDNCDKFDFD